VVNPIRFLVSNYLASNHGVLLVTEEIIEVMLEDGQTIVVRRNELPPVVIDPVANAKTWDELQRFADDDSRPDLAIKARQRMTDIIAAQTTGRTEPLFTQVRVANETILLDRHDCATLRQQFATAQRAVVGCQKHERSIKCACLASWREWYYALQRQCPNSPLALAAQNLWDLVERFSQEYERPKELTSELEAIIETIGNQNSEDSPWLGKRSEAGKQHQRELAARRRARDYR
jgi:acid phosphatase class B